jgi:hypothetical protein
MNFWHFLRENVWAGAAVVLGPLVAAGSLLLHAFALHEMGLPIEAWAAIGLVIFFVGVVSILYRVASIRAATLENRTTTQFFSPLDVWLESNEDPSVHFKRKLRIVLQNISGTNIIVQAAAWERRGGTDIPIRNLRDRRDGNIIVGDRMNCRKSWFLQVERYEPG